MIVVNFLEELYCIPGFELLRNSNGDGILAYVNTDLNSTRRTHLENNNLGVLCVQIFSFKSKRPLLFDGVYRPRNSTTI